MHTIWTALVAHDPEHLPTPEACAFWHTGTPFYWSRPAAKVQRLAWYQNNPQSA